MELVPDDWLSIFRSEAPLFELVARASSIYLAILLLLRVLPRRTAGDLATMDLVLIVLIAQAAMHALGSFDSVTDSVVLIVTMAGWDYVINILSYRVRFIERLVSAPPLQIVRDGRLLRRNMRREYVTEEELMAHLRMHGLESVEDVKAAFVESEGKVTVVPKKPKR